MSAFQYRDGGVKGVMCVVNDPTLGEWEVRERNSSVKFYSNVRELSVIKVRGVTPPSFGLSGLSDSNQVATYARATLNRQAMLLMEALGVPTETLLQIFRIEKRAIEGLDDGFDPRRLSMVSVASHPYGLC